jgi:hypothetical protein
MARGGGKYEEVCRLVQGLTNAEGCLVVVFGGDLGGGFSLAVDSSRLDPNVVVARLPTMLRSIAASIEAEVPEG